MKFNTMKNTGFCLRFCLFFLVSVLCACSEPPPPGKQADNPDASAPPRKQRIALVMKTLTNPFFIEMEKGARKAEAELGVELIVKTAAQETSFEQQVSIVEDMVQNRSVDALVLAPADAYHLVPSAKNAWGAGIPVVNLDAKLNQKELDESGLHDLPFISVDNEQGGYLSARALIEGVHRPAQAIILEGIRRSENANSRKAGALRAFAENPLVTLVASEAANWKIDEAYDVSKKLFARHPGISLIFAANDMMALGALKYLEESGRKHVRVAGFDALHEARDAINKGLMLVSVDQQAAEQGYMGILYAARLLKGEKLPATTLLNVKLVRAPLVAH